MSKQRKLEAMVKALVEKFGVEKAIQSIKESRCLMFEERKHFPNGVYVFCSSPEGGVMVGRRR